MKPKILIEMADGKIIRITSTQDTQFILAIEGEEGLGMQRQNEILPDDLLDDRMAELLEKMMKAPF